MGIQDHIRKMEAAQAEKQHRAQRADLDAQAKVGPANRLLRQLSQEAVELLKKHDMARGGLEVVCVKRFGHYSVETRRVVWLLLGGRITHLGFLDDGTPVWTSPVRMPGHGGQGQMTQKDFDKLRRRVEAAVEAARCVIPISPATTPASAQGAPPPHIVTDSAQPMAFYLGQDGRLKYGHEGSELDVEKEFAQSIFERRAPVDWWTY